MVLLRKEVGSSRTFRYGYLVTSSRPNRSIPPSTAPSQTVRWLTFMTTGGVQGPGTYSPQRC